MEPDRPNTVFLLMAMYGARAAVPLELVCRDFFRHLSPAQLDRKATAGEIDIPILRIDPGSQKSAKAVHICDLADWIDNRRALAQKECAEIKKSIEANETGL